MSIVTVRRNSNSGVEGLESFLPQEVDPRGGIFSVCVFSRSVDV